MAKTFMSIGRVGPNRATAGDPSHVWGSAEIASTNETQCPSRRTSDASLGCAPIHNSAWGSPVTGQSNRSAISVVEPHA